MDLQVDGVLGGLAVRLVEVLVLLDEVELAEEEARAEVEGISEHDRHALHVCLSA
jgi:hypothetical protein